VTGVTDARPLGAQNASTTTTTLRTEDTMKANVGSIDRVLRLVLGLALIALAATGIVGAWGWLGVVPVATALFRFCPAYTLLGVNTCGIKKT
jgi:hypothetical protein